MTPPGSHGSALRYGSDAEPGIRRRGSKRFSYVREGSGRPVSKSDVERIRALAIPPAWTDVWIAGDARSHVQATGRDAKRRKQYRYHPEHTSSRSAGKFADLVAFAAALGRIRRRVTRDLRSSELRHDQVVAVVVRLLDETGLRVGNAQYTRDNGSFGLTTLRDRHARVRGSRVQLSFRGKSKHQFDVDVDSAPLARVVRRCQHLPGQHLFQYERDRERRVVTSSDVNAYLAEHGNAGITAKTFRTWNATVLAAELFAAAASDGIEPTPSAVNDVIDAVAHELGNTRAVCRSSYVHPALIDGFIDGTLLSSWNRPVGTRPSGLSAAERRTLRLVKRAP